MTTTELKALGIGDCLRMSVELIQGIADMPKHQSELVQVVDIRQESDGTKTLILTRADNQKRDPFHV